MYVFSVYRSFCESPGTLLDAPKILDLNVLAEGVEEQAQFAFLKQLGCDGVQGILRLAGRPPQSTSRICSDRSGPIRLPGRLVSASTR
jgi:predicted signal transduction protein with EAL and GGDEF domain